jgi:hypothetical protein
MTVDYGRDYIWADMNKNYIYSRVSDYIFCDETCGKIGVQTGSHHSAE